MKKKIIAIIVVFLIAVISVGFIFGDDISAIVAHREIVSDYDDYPIKNIEQNNYILESTRQEADDGIVLYSFVIKDKTSKDIIYKCPDAWRSWDLKYIGFIGDGLDILVASADVGETYYNYADSEWTEIVNAGKTDYSQLGEDKAVFISDDYQEYFDFVSDLE